MMDSQAEEICEINRRTGDSALAAFEERPSQSPWRFALSLVIHPSWAFLGSFILAGGPFGGSSALRSAVNAWAERYIAIAKHYELIHADQGKAMAESRDFG